MEWSNKYHMTYHSLIRRHLCNMFAELVDPWLTQPLTVGMAMRIADEVRALVAELEHEVSQLSYPDDGRLCGYQQGDLFDDVLDDLPHDLPHDLSPGLRRDL